jgi:maltose O-acetyltransferase
MTPHFKRAVSRRFFATFRRASTLPFVHESLRVYLLRLGNVPIRSARILENVRITGTGLEVGSGVFINADCYIDGASKVLLEDGVSLAQGVRIITATHHIGDPKSRAGAMRYGSVRVGRGAWVGANVVILPGVTIGAGSIVGAGAVVAQDIPSNVVAAGVPARVLRTLDN